MLKIISTDTDHPFSFPEGRQTFISKPHPADERPPGPLCLGAEFSFEYVQICSPVLRNDERGASLKILKSSASHASKRKPRGSGGRDFISFISAISEGQSTPCHTCTGLSPLAVSASVFFSREISQASHCGFVRPAQAWSTFYTATEHQEPAGLSHDPPVSANILPV